MGVIMNERSPGRPPKWPPPIEWIEQDLRRGDATSLENRIARYTYVASRFPIGDGLFMGGVPQLFAFEEMQRSYVSGNYMAVVLCAQVFAEHSLAIPYVMTGDSRTTKGGFAKLIDQSVADGELSKQEAEQLHILRRMRNPYIHPAMGADGYDGRLVDGKHPLTLLQEDAEFALDTVAIFIRKSRAH